MNKLQAKIKRLKNKALRLWKIRVKARANNRCEICGETKLLNAHHIEGYRNCPALRYDVRVGFASCPSHHKWGIDAAHNSFIVMYDYMTQHRPEDIEYLREHRKDNIEYTEEVLLNIIKGLEGNE